MHCMVASSIPCKLSLRADRAHACAGDSHASSGIDVACPTTQNVLAIASPHDLQGDSWPSSSTGTSSFCCNHQYSVTAITTSAGSIAERYAYSAYGQPTILDASASVLSSSAINNRYTYTGREWDATLGLHHFRARWMSTSAGRFLSRDPIGYMDGLSLYGNFMVLGTLDPSGESTFEILLNTKITNERCVGCGDSKWIVQYSLDASSVPPNGKPRVIGYIVQKVCNEKRRTHCECRDNNPCIETKTEICKACAYEMIGAILAGNGKMMLFPIVKDIWKNFGTQDQDCISKGAGIISADIRVLPPHQDLKDWADGIPKGGPLVIIPDGCKGEGVGFAPNSRELTGPAPAGWDQPLSTSRAAAWQRWNCCPKPVDGSPSTTCDSLHTGWNNAISGED